MQSEGPAHLAARLDVPAGKALLEALYNLLLSQRCAAEGAVEEADSLPCVHALVIPADGRRSLRQRLQGTRP